LESWVIRPAEVIDVDDERVLVLLDIEARSKTPPGSDSAASLHLECRFI
jgi:hypothetical protein